MLRVVLLFNLILCPLVISKRRHKSPDGGDLGAKLVTSLRNDVNIDLPEDEEYEDLRAELLAYHTALASITAGRRSMKTTPCWQLGGICVDHKLCEGHRSLSEVNACRNNLEVCCFTWNKYNVRNMRDKGIEVLAMPWSESRDFGGKGVLDPPSSDERKKKKSKNRHDNIHHDNSHHNSHHDNSHHSSHHDNSYHDKKHHEDSHHENTPHKKPILVILRT